MKFLILLTVLFFMSCGDATDSSTGDTVKESEKEACVYDVHCEDRLKCFHVRHHTDRANDGIGFYKAMCLIDCGFEDNKKVKGFYERPFYSCHYYTEDYLFGGEK